MGTVIVTGVYPRKENSHSRSENDWMNSKQIPYFNTGCLNQFSIMCLNYKYEWIRFLMLQRKILNEWELMLSRSSSCWVSVDLKLSPGENTSWAWNQEEIMNLKLYSLWFKGRSQRRQGASPPLGHKVQKIQQTYQLKFTFSQEGEIQMHRIEFLKTFITSP